MNNKNNRKHVHGKTKRFNNLHVQLHEEVSLKISLEVNGINSGRDEGNT